MKVLVIGTGSIGRRHVANLVALGAEVRAFSYRFAAGDTVPAFPGIPYVDNLTEAIDECDALVVSNRTDQHMAVALEAARREKHLFIEKPLGVSLAGCDQLRHMAASKNLVVEAGFMLRFHPNLLCIRRSLQEGLLGEPMHIRAAVGQWLPDWRPGTDYSKGYSAFRHTGGGVIFDLIHELDLVNWLAGPVIEVSAMTRHVPCLNIETEAIAQIGLRLASGALAQVHLDYVRPGYGRTMELVGSEGILTWDYLAGEVFLEQGKRTTQLLHRLPPEFERNSMFSCHMAHFLNRLTDPGLEALSSLEQSIQALRIALACHRSATERRVVLLEEIEASYQP